MYLHFACALSAVTSSSTGHRPSLLVREITATLLLSPSARNEPEARDRNAARRTHRTHNERVDEDLRAAVKRMPPSSGGTSDTRAASRRPGPFRLGRGELLVQMFVLDMWRRDAEARIVEAREIPVKSSCGR